MGGTTNQREALQYAKNFQPFALNHQKGESGVTFLMFSTGLWPPLELKLILTRSNTYLLIKTIIDDNHRKSSG